MYQPSAFREERLETLHALIRAHPLATLITGGTGGLIANLVPFTLADTGGKGTLRAHIAKANDQVEALKSVAETLSFSKARKRTSHHLGMHQRRSTGGLFRRGTMPSFRSGERRVSSMTPIG